MSVTDFAEFLQRHVDRVEPLSREVNIAYWNATVSGKAKDFERSAELQVELQRVYSDPTEYEMICNWLTGGSAANELERRQATLLSHAYRRNQIDPSLNERITKLQSKIDNQFNVYRASINGKKATSNDILKVLKESDDSNSRRRVWEAGKQVGQLVVDDLITLVKLRNEAANSLGYSTYYAMSMDLNEQDEAEIVRIFDELEVLSREPFQAAKDEVDRRLASRYGIGTDDMRPWHYEDPFFQEAPRVFDIDLDRYYRGHRILDLVSRFYRGIGLEVDGILARSDLYEKPGKDQHAFCTDIDRKGDIRILANIKDDETWTGTMLHELGHAVHDRYIDPDLPYLLRQEAHIFTTEAIAMLFGRLSKHPDWIQDTMAISDEEKERITDDLLRSLRLQQLIFARWSQVMMRFERQLYLDPDRNLSRLWWDLAGQYQSLAPPDDCDFPHWASKTHIVTSPVYYHNYLLGELLASQLGDYIMRNVLPEGSNRSFSGQKAVGEYLKQKVFGPGARYRWDSLISRATGEPLSSKYFVQEFVEQKV